MTAADYSHPRATQTEGEEPRATTATAGGSTGPEGQLDSDLDRARAKRYNRIKLTVGIMETVLTFAVLGLLLVSGWSARIAQFATTTTSNPYIALLLFAACVGLVETVFSFPLGFYSGYIVEHRYGLSNQTVLGWLREHLKGTAVGVVLGTPILLAFYFFLRQLGSLWWLPVAIVLFLFAVLLARLAPTLIFPLFYKFEPLPDSSLKQEILRLAQHVGMRVEGIFRFNLSKNTKKANAAFTGIGRSKRVLLADTLLDSFEDDEIETVVAHELGHFKFGHIRIGILIGFITTFLGLYLTSVLYARSLAWFGFTRLDELAALPLLALWLGVYGLITTPIQNAISRRFEWQADRFAVQLTGKSAAFARALRKLSAQNLSDPEPHPLVEFLFYSHPAISKRIAAVLAAGESTRAPSDQRPAVAVGG